MKQTERASTSPQGAHILGRNFVSADLFLNRGGKILLTSHFCHESDFSQIFKPWLQPIYLIKGSHDPEIGSMLRKKTHGL